MSPANVLDIANEGLWVLLKISTPIMLVALVVGLTISLIQALTQIQEMTLTFVPKIISIFLVLMAIMPFIAMTLSGFAELIFDRIQNIGMS